MTDAYEALKRDFDQLVDSKNRYFSQCGRLLSRIAVLEQQRRMILAAVYAEAPKFVATICDQKLDPSGALLGEVRALSDAAIKGTGQ